MYILADDRSSRDATIWLAIGVATDTIITAVLLVKFYSMRTSFKGTNNVIRKLVLAALRNGSITTAMTIATIVLFLAQPNTNNDHRSCLYIRTILANLNNRSTMRGEDTQHRTSERAIGDPNTSVQVHIRRDIETQGANSMHMHDLQYGVKERELNSSDRNSEEGRNYGFV
ncbi:hypothetical protein DFH09DRAFT_1331883 [Mycena vulgaris]|nr:hypothetical protein DFH09DRAFT_1331883 [Mycena vulgaris]